MFPIIPQYFFNNSAISTNAIKHNTSSIPTSIFSQSDPKTNVKKVTVRSSINDNVCSLPLDVKQFIEDQDTEEEITVSSENNTLKFNSSSWSWIKNLKLAKDCQSYNVMLFENSDSTIRLRTTKKLAPYEELTLWFSHEILLILRVPFLSPTNIQGEKQYICHSCKFHCEMPNPLKIHIALNCDKEGIQDLWNRLIDHKRDKFKAQQFQFSLPKYPAEKPDLIVNNNTESAFKPYVKKEIPEYAPIREANVFDEKFDDVPDNILYKQAVEMETIVSNLGRFRQGHLCIYCGKVYSRKYGLKIHIRTHTGFKPLKCKYCLRPFGDPSNLNKHVRLHSEGDTPYKCDLCGKLLVRKRDLDRHLKSRHTA